eukprot:CAMPEP_0195098346 /NCGR_PEP_ID=MMETSP0448-20130528/57391_1 /TAXON_ID=66468 /ORGANISM="Heterocapsa triquestra, Strain CCMP 448" /LENGTH=41 /DNA_ID= /DNA_START= /DNA_END= /DNA_ORIENTATION=
MAATPEVTRPTRLGGALTLKIDIIERWPSPEAPSSEERLKA